MNFLLMTRFAFFFLLSAALHITLGWWLRMPAAQAGQALRPALQPVMTVSLLALAPLESVSAPAAVSLPATSVLEYPATSVGSPVALPSSAPVVKPKRITVAKTAPEPALGPPLAARPAEKAVPQGHDSGAVLASPSSMAAAAESEPAEVFSSQPAFLQPPIQPRYPQQAQRRNQQGVVTIEVRLDALGQQRSINVVSSSGVESLDKAALDAVAAWHFRPEVVAGMPVPSRVRIPIQFALMANR